MRDKTVGMLLKAKPDPRCFESDEELPIPNKYIGIEIEAENVNIVYDDIEPNLLYWTVKPDGSLRNYGAEFVSRKLRGRDVKKALLELERFFAKYEITPDYTHRTSTHIHADVRALAVGQLQNLIVTGLVVEPWLFNHVGKDRESNIYCVPFYKNNNGIFNLSKFFDDREVMFQTALHGARKYEAMNFLSMSEHGTVEFRHHYGCHDKDALLTWIKTILHIFRMSKNISFNYVWERVSAGKIIPLAKELLPYIDVREDKVLINNSISNLLFLKTHLDKLFNTDFAQAYSKRMEAFTTPTEQTTGTI